MDDTTALRFNTICNFIRDLNESFGSRQKSLLLYNHLIEKTGLIHMEPVRRHIQIFNQFIRDNEEAIIAKNKKLLKTHVLLYSEKVAIDLGNILQICDADEERVIWTHLLTISAILHPEGRAKQVLKDTKPVKEDNFLKNIMDKIGEQVQAVDGEDVNPMQMIGNMMSSGVFNEIFQGLSGGVENGNLDLGKMMNSMQDLMSNLNTMVQEKTPTTTIPPPDPTLDK
jgi:hypothetical protein